MRARTVPALTALAVTALTLTACGDGGTRADDISLVVTTTPLGSVTGQIASCAGGTATTLMPVNADPHDFSASSSQVADMVKADLVIANGLGLEGGLDAALGQVEADGTPVLRVAEHVDPLPFGAAGHGDGDHHEGHDHGSHGDLDPHFWLDVSRMARAAEAIGDRVAEVTGEQKWAECGAQISGELAELDGEVREALQAVPADRRTIVTDHQAYGYFNAAYDFHSAGVVIPGGSTEAQPSSQELAALAGVIREEKVPVIFTNAAVNQTLVDAVAREVGGDISVVSLYEGSVGPEGSGAEDYQGMMRENARLIVDALG